MASQTESDLRILTGEDCASLLDDLRAVLARASLNLESLELWQDLEDVRWLATQKGFVLQGYENPHDPSRKRRLQGFRDAVFIKRSIKAIELTRDYEGWRQPVDRL